MTDTRSARRRQALEQHIVTDPNVIVAKQIMINTAALLGSASRKGYEAAVRRSIESFNARERLLR